MDAWDILRAESTAPNGSDAWVLLNNIEGGGGVIGIGLFDGDIIGADQTLRLSEPNNRLAFVKGTDTLEIEPPSNTLKIKEELLGISIRQCE